MKPAATWLPNSNSTTSPNGTIGNSNYSTAPCTKRVREDCKRGADKGPPRQGSWHLDVLIEQNDVAAVCEDTLPLFVVTISGNSHENIRGRGTL